MQAEAPSFLSPPWKCFASMETHVTSLLRFKAVFTRRSWCPVRPKLFVLSCVCDLLSYKDLPLSQLCSGCATSSTLMHQAELSDRLSQTSLIKEIISLQTGSDLHSHSAQFRAQSCVSAQNKKMNERQPHPTMS